MDGGEQRRTSKLSGEWAHNAYAVKCENTLSFVLLSFYICDHLTPANSNCKSQGGYCTLSEEYIGGLVTQLVSCCSDNGMKYTCQYLEMGLKNSATGITWQRADQLMDFLLIYNLPSACHITLRGLHFKQKSSEGVPANLLLCTARSARQ